MKKKIITSFIIFFLVLFIAYVIFSISQNGYFYLDKAWGDTPMEALELELNYADVDERECLTVKKLVDTRYFENHAIIYFVSEKDCFTVVSFVKNDSGKYHFYELSEELVLSSPNSFVLNGEKGQLALSSYRKFDDTVFGWKYSSTPTVLINELKTNEKSYSFVCQGELWNIDFWWIDNISTDEITLEYKNN